jgi:hypothetical protein
LASVIATAAFSAHIPQSLAANCAVIAVIPGASTNTWLVPDCADSANPEKAALAVDASRLRLLDIPLSGPDTEFSLQADDGISTAVQVTALNSIHKAARLDPDRLQVRPVPGKVTIHLTHLTPNLAALTHTNWAQNPNGSRAAGSITIDFNVDQLSTEADFDTAAGHEYAHAIHNSLGLVSLPTKIREGIGYWTDYTNVYPEGEGPLDVWAQQILPNWDLYRQLALQQYALVDGRVVRDDDRTQLGALATGYLWHRIGARQYLQVLLTAQQPAVPMDSILVQYAGLTFNQAENEVRTILGQPDGGRSEFTSIAR